MALVATVDTTSTLHILTQTRESDRPQPDGNFGRVPAGIAAWRALGQHYPSRQRPEFV